MNFKGHIIAGTIVGLCSSLVASAFAGATPSLQFQIVVITASFSLMPDLDVSSIPQRWFYRCIFVLLIYLAMNNQYKAATLIAISSITPILSHHRSWTHSLWSAIFVPCAFILMYNFLTTPSHYNDFLIISNVTSILKANMWFIIAASLGWLTHLYVDYKLGKGFK